MFILTEFREVVDRKQAATSRLGMQAFGHHASNNSKRVPSVPTASSTVKTHTTSTIHTILYANQSEHIDPAHSQGIVSLASSAATLQEREPDPNISPLVSLARPSDPSTTSQNNALDMLNSAYFSNYTSPPGSDTQQQEPMILSIGSRQNSLDVCLDISLLSEAVASNMGSDMGTDTEVDFEKLHYWASTSSGLTPGGGGVDGATAHGGNDARGSMYASGNFDMYPNFQGFG